MQRIAKLLSGSSIISLALVILSWKTFDLHTARIISTIAGVIASLSGIILFAISMPCQGDEGDDTWRPLYFILSAFIIAGSWVIVDYVRNKYHSRFQTPVLEQRKYQQSTQQGQQEDDGGMGGWWNMIHATVLWPR
jgi:hypothetical protein